MKFTNFLMLTMTYDKISCHQKAQGSSHSVNDDRSDSYLSSYSGFRYSSVVQRYRVRVRHSRLYRNGIIGLHCATVYLYMYIYVYRQREIEVVQLFCSPTIYKFETMRYRLTSAGYVQNER